MSAVVSALEAVSAVPETEKDALRLIREIARVKIEHAELLEENAYLKRRVAEEEARLRNA